MTFEDKAKVVIAQLRADRDRLAKALKDIRAEIDEQYERVHQYDISCAEGLEMALGIIDKYMVEGSKE